MTEVRRDDCSRPIESRIQPEHLSPPQVLKPNTLYSVDFFGNAKELPELQAEYNQIITKALSKRDRVLQKMREDAQKDKS